MVACQIDGLPTRSMDSSNTITKLLESAEWVAKATHICVLSGAGISKASGIPTYRDIGGLWESGDNLKFSHIDGYRDYPAQFAKFWKDRIREMSGASPNPAHTALRDLQRLKPSTRLVTQNVDGLLREAGCTDVIELHGNLRELKCPGCTRVSGPALFGRCLRCGGRTRPNVVMFGENLKESVLKAAQDSARNCEVMIVVGTSALVYPAAQLPIIALNNGARLIVMDVEKPLIGHAAHCYLEGKAEELLPELVQRATQPSNRRDY